MMQTDFKQIFQALQTFILLKQQNLIIYSWMQLKKRNRKIYSLHGSRNNQIYGGPYHYKNNKNNINFNNNYPTQPQYTLYSQSPRILKKDIRLLTQNYTNPQYSNVFDGLGRNPQTNRYTLTQKSINRNQMSRGLFPTENQEQQLEDTDEFEDIVLDRLSKLEENINNLMKQKKLKEQKRGNVGTPISSPEQKRKNDQKINQIYKNRPETRITNLLQRKKKFFQSLKMHQNQSQRQQIHNLKYIPVNQNGDEADIKKIRKIIQNKYQQDNFIEGIDYFNRANPRNNNEQHSRRASTSLYMNRYVNNQRGSQRIHYAPNHIQIQSVIEQKKRRPRYSFYDQNDVKDKELNKSNISKDYVTAKRNNLSSFY